MTFLTFGKEFQGHNKTLSVTVPLQLLVTMCFTAVTLADEQVKTSDEQAV